MVPPYAQYAEVRRLKLAERMKGEVVDEEQIDAEDIARHLFVAGGRDALPAHSRTGAI
jgi:hypothetical protein